MRYELREKWLAVAMGAGLAACGGGRPSYSARSTPPEVAFAASPPAYTTSATVALSVSARNPEGVRAVYALAGSQRFAARPQGDGTWQATVQLPVVGKNTVTIWAEDNGSPTPNSGQGMDAPYQLVQDVVYDPTPPTVSYDPSFASYSDERNLQVEADANGASKVPPAYVTGSKVGVLPGGDFYKAWTRLAGGPDMKAIELETTNVNNIPVLRFVVPYNRNTDAPIQTPKFLAHVTCAAPCSALPDADGELLPSATPDDQRALFDLPLSSEAIPALANLQGTATVAITLTVADAAGNTATVPGFNFNFHVIGPPLAISEDAQYPAAAKAESAFAYHLANGSYGAMWAVGPSFASNTIRLTRYIITNPVAAEVGLQLAYAQDASGSWQMLESWKHFTAPEPIGRNADGGIYLNRPDTSTAFSLDGFTFHNAAYWRVPYGTTNGPLAQGEYGAHPCGSTLAGSPFHRLGDAANKYLCDTTSGANLFSTAIDIITASTSDVSLWPYRVAPELQGQERVANRDASGQWYLVPPAVGGVPGVLVVYVARTVLASRAKPLQWNLAVAPPSTAEPVNHFQTWDYEWWSGYYQPWSILYSGYDTYVANRAGAYLVSAQESLRGAISGTTHAYLDGFFLGEPAPRLAVSISREPLAVH